MAPEAENVPASQLEQSSAPVPLTKVPGKHREQDTEPVEEAWVPARQSVQPDAPLVEYVPFGQSVHDSRSEAL